MEHFSFLFSKSSQSEKNDLIISVEAQKDYHRIRGNLQMSAFTPQILTSTTTVDSRQRPGFQTTTGSTDYMDGSLDYQGRGHSGGGRVDSELESVGSSGSHQINQYTQTSIYATR